MNANSQEQYAKDRPKSILPSPYPVNLTTQALIDEIRERMTGMEGHQQRTMLEHIADGFPYEIKGHVSVI